MSFLNPTYLWALLGLLLPIAIHLWSKKEGKTIKIGSIELLRESESKQTSSFRPNELVLLLLRMFIIALVTLVLAEPQLKLKAENAAITYLIEPSLLKQEKSATLLNSIDAAHSIRLLDHNFPELDYVDLENLTTKTPNYWQLARDMHSIASDSIVVYTKAYASGFKGMRPSVNKHIEWVVIDTEEKNDKLPIKATRVGSNIEILSMQSNGERTAFEKTLLKESDSNQIDLNVITEKPVAILVYYDDAFIDDSKYLEASLSAVSKHLNRTFNITNTQDATNLDLRTYDFVIWLTENNPAPDGAKKLLEYKLDNLSNSLIAESLTKNQHYLTRHLTTTNSVESYLPEQLLNILDLHSDLATIIQENDQRVFSKDELLPQFSATELTKNPTNSMSISKWIWLILGITMLGERLIASYRKQ
tara:strand:+ start:65547 stop:66800 length:1254 start_codon:yes stop_codon:yes gene_type:complete